MDKCHDKILEKEVEKNRMDVVEEGCNMVVYAQFLGDGISDNYWLQACHSGDDIVITLC